MPRMKRRRVAMKAFRSFLLLALVIPLVETTSYSAQSTITEVEGYACMGYDKSKKQTEEEALTNAKRMAVEHASTYIKSETRVKDFQLEKDLIDAYANASVKIIQELQRSWYREASSGDCFKVKIKAEVVPDEKAMTKISKGTEFSDDPSAPLHVQVWTDKKEYRQAEKIRVYLKGNKPFYARILHKNTQGGFLQLLPNPYREDNYFQGGVVYEFPSGKDRFDLEVIPPFGEEGIIVYAGTNPLVEIDLKAVGTVYEVKTKQPDIGIKTRAVKISPKEGGKDSGASEFFEGKVTLKTK
jgi:hypothetical protein